MFKKSLEDVFNLISEKNNVFKNWNAGNLEGSLWSNLSSSSKNIIDIEALTDQFKQLRDMTSGENAMSLGVAIDEYIDLDEIVKEYAQTNDIASKSTDDFKKHLLSLNKSSGLAKIGLKALAVVSETVASAFASWAISQIISGIAKLVDYLNVTTEELNDLTAAFNEGQSELQNLEKELEETQSRLIELQSIENPTYVERDEISKLQETNQELETQIVLLKERQRLAAIELLEEAKKASNSYKYKNFQNKNRGYTPEDAEYTSDNASTAVTNSIREMQNAKTELDKLRQEQVDLNKNIDTANENSNTAFVNYFSAASQVWEKKIDKAEEEYNNLTSNAADEVARAQALVDAYEAVYAAGGELTEEEMADFISAKSAVEIYIETLKELQEERKKSFAEKSVEEKRTSIDTYMQLGGIEDEDTRKELLASISDRELDIVAGLHFDSSMTVESLREAINEAKGIVAENGEIEVPLTVSRSVNQVAQQLKPQFDALGEAYKAIFYTDEGFSHKNVDTEMLENLRSAFQDISDEAKEMGLSAIPTDQLDNFLDTLADVNVEQEDTQQAFNDIATTWLYSTGVIDDLNDATATSVEKMLEEMGVTNANEVVTLNLAAAKEYAAEKGEDLADASASDIAAFAAERIQANALSVDLIKVYLGKIRANMAQIESKDDIDNLIAIAKAAGATSESLAKLEAIKNSVNGEGTTAMQRLQLRQTVDADENLDVGLNVDIEDFMPNKDDAGSAGKDAADAYVESFEKELKTLEALKDQGKITEKEYLDYLRQLYERYFKDREEYLDKYKEYEDKYLRGKIYAPFYSNVDYKK